MFVSAISVTFCRAAQRFVHGVCLCPRHGPKSVVVFTVHLALSQLSISRFRERPRPWLTDGYSHFCVLFLPSSVPSL